MSMSMTRSIRALLATLLVLALPATASAATLSATPSTFADVYASAQAGDIIELASGDYGTFAGSLKSGEVIIREQADAAATMTLDISAASNLTFDGLKVRGAEIAGSQTKNITIRNGDFDGGWVVLRGNTLANANVLLEGNRFTNRDVCSGCYAGRVQIAERTDTPTGITIRGNYFSGGNADGIQNGGNGVVIEGNEFTNLAQGDANVAHTDAVQLYGSKGTVIRGNYFHGVSVAIGAYDRVDHEVIEDNVVVGDGTSAYVMQFLSDDGSVIRHNTFARRSSTGTLACAYNVPCGTILFGNKSIHPQSTGTVFNDNILTAISVDGSPPAYASEDYNLFAGVVGTGPNDLQGEPTYTGGLTPSSYAGFSLANGSLGKGNASDGLDRGVRFSTSSPPPPPPPPPPPLPAETVYAPLCEPLCDETIAAQRSKLDRMHDALHDTSRNYKQRVDRANAIFHE